MEKNEEVETEAVAATANHVELQRERLRLVKLVADTPSEKEMKLNLRQLMHEYNEVKDAAQTVIGALANIQCVTLKSLHEEFELPLK